MRRLDWFLAAIVASFLVGVLAVQAFGWRLDGFDIRWTPAPSVETTVRRLVIPHVVSPMRAVCPAPWVAVHAKKALQS